MTIPPFLPFQPDAAATTARPPGAYPSIGPATPAVPAYAAPPSIVDRLRQAVALGAANGMLNLPVMQLARQMAHVGKQAMAGDRQGAFMGLAGLGTQFLPGNGAAEDAPVLLHELIGKSQPEVEGIFAKTIQDDRGLLGRLFGEEGAKRYSQLQRKANAQYATDEQMNAATDEIGKMEDALTPQQQNLLYGIGQPKGALNAEDIGGMRGMVTNNTPELLKSDPTPHLTEQVARILGGNAFDQPGHKIAAVNILRELHARGVDPTPTIGSYLTSALRLDPIDASSVLRDRLSALNRFAGGQY